jgi:hypothetical protein
MGRAGQRPTWLIERGSMKMVAPQAVPGDAPRLLSLRLALW